MSALSPPPVCVRPFPPISRTRVSQEEALAGGDEAGVGVLASAWVAACVPLYCVHAWMLSMHTPCECKRLAAEGGEATGEEEPGRARDDVRVASPDVGIVSAECGLCVYAPAALSLAFVYLHMKRRSSRGVDCVSASELRCFLRTDHMCAHTLGAHSVHALGALCVFRAPTTGTCGRSAVDVGSIESGSIGFELGPIWCRSMRNPVSICGRSAVEVGWIGFELGPIRCRPMHDPGSICDRSAADLGSIRGRLGFIAADVVSV